MAKTLRNQINSFFSRTAEADLSENGGFQQESHCCGEQIAAHLDVQARTNYHWDRRCPRPFGAGCFCSPGFVNRLGHGILQDLV